MIATIYQNITKYQVTLIQNVTNYHVTIGQEVNHFKVSISQNVTRTVTTIFQLGEKGKAGIKGKSAYQIAVENGFVGTESEWIESLNNLDLVVKNEIPLGIMNGQNATFTSLSDFIPETLEVFSNGLKQTLISDYLTSGSRTILLKFSPAYNENLTINYLKQL